MVLLIDNYDSFSYNLFQYIGEMCGEPLVARNNEITCEEIEEMNPSHIVISPGPGKPSQAGICKEVVLKFQGKIPIMGVCLGHQVICEAFGGIVSYSEKLMHGKSSEIILSKEERIFQKIPKIITVGRYHSLEAKKEKFPHCLKVIASTINEEIMAVRHKEHEIYGLQFHPESILTPEGKNILTNFFRRCINDTRSN